MQKRRCNIILTHSLFNHLQAATPNLLVKIDSEKFTVCIVLTFSVLIILTTTHYWSKNDFYLKVKIK